MCQRVSVIVALLMPLLVSACGKRVPEPVGPARDAPHVSWVIMSGDRSNPDQTFVCQSDPRTDCVITASRPGAPVVADLHVYYHGVGKGTSYAGSMRVGFFPGPAASQTFQASAIAAKAEAIVNQSVAGLVTEAPGNYALSFTLTATATDTGQRRPVIAEVPVIVR